MTYKRVMGVLPGKKDIRDYTFKKKVCRAANYPDEYECPIKTPIKDQGFVGSCTAHATAEIMEYHSPDDKLSTNFIYGIHYKLFGTKGPGMYLREAAKIVSKYGDPKYELCPGNNEVDFVYKIAEDAFENEEAMTSASEHKISSYAKVSAFDDIKYALMNHGPVLAAVTWYIDYKLDADGVIHRGSKVDGGHAIVIRGWNEKGWICQNSWGKSWGKKGYFILPYDYKISEAYSFVAETSKEPSDDIVKPNWCKLLTAIINFILNFFN